MGYLEDWRARPGRKPLILRGARQVGKSTVLRQLGTQFDELVEIDFELNPETASLFEAKDPNVVVPLIEAYSNTDIVPGRTLVLLDEAQAAPQVLASLRYFHEKMPELHVVVAGSLLDFALGEGTFSVPVGRVEFMWLGPLTFEEFLGALGEHRLVSFVKELGASDDVPDAIHERLLARLRTYMTIGGMPEAVATYVRTGSFRECERVKRALLTGFEADFAKYGPKARPDRLRKVFRKSPRLVGQRFKYANVDRDERSKDLAPALEMLERARLIHRIRHSAGNGPPLGAERDDRKLKLLLLDVGLVSTACGLDVIAYEQADEITAVNAGALAEQLVGQHLLYAHPPWVEPNLYFWARERRGSRAEVDYLLSLGVTVAPVEVKAGKGGRLKSMHLFLRETGRRLGGRLDDRKPSILDTRTAIPDGDDVDYRLMSLPLYLCGQILRLVATDTPT